MGKSSRKKHKHSRRDSYDSYSSDSYERRRRRRRRSPSSDDYRPRRRIPPPRRQRSPMDSRPYRFDSPPKDQDNVMNAMAAAKAVGGGLADAQNIMQSIQSMSMAQASKVDRKLYVGNLPPGITPKELVDLVNHALSKVGNNKAIGDPVISAWISSDSHYAFVEFRSPEEADCGFALNNISIHGHTLKVGRPNTYNGVFSNLKLLSNSALLMGDSMLNPEKHATNVLDADESMFDPLGEKKMLTEGGEPKKEPEPPQIKDETEEKPDPNKDLNANPILTKMGMLNATTAGKMNPFMGGVISNEIYKIELPCRVIVLKNIVKYEYVAYEDDYENLLEDLKKELVKYGMIVNIKIPHYPFLEARIQDEENTQEEKKVLNQDEIDLEIIKAKLPKKEGFGNVYVEFVSTDEAKRARKELLGRRYGESYVDVCFHSEDKFERDDFSSYGVITTGKENMYGFEGMEHLAIEFKDGAQSSVQEEIRNQRKTMRESTQYQLAIKDQPNRSVQPAQGYRKEDVVILNNNPVIKDEK